MLVTDIEISHYQYCPKTMRHVANVCLTLKNQIVTLYCQLDLPAHENTTSRTAAFVGEATRQLRRMPEFRSGMQSLDVPAEIAGRLRLNPIPA